MSDETEIRKLELERRPEYRPKSSEGGEYLGGGGWWIHCTVYASVLKEQN